mmetsp:Transcript_118420/g.264742  ORF Transcript_118420/g.264742 Transcript_118420/m.264742 type:complete len:360 (+) Transcript_118420:91-1170(+)
MGNTPVFGHALNLCGCTKVLGFESSAKMIISVHGIEPWNARELIKANLRRQGELATRSPLRLVPVAEGLQFIGAKMKSWFQTRLTREQFAQTCADLMTTRKIPHTHKDRDDLYDIFDSMDFDKNGFLSLGEWAGGLSVFFKGDTAHCVRAVFDALDGDNSRSLTKAELQEYLKPFVKAMSPPEAESLRPLLLQKATDDIYMEMDLDHEKDISSDEMLLWTSKGNNIVEKLADLIDKEVYQIWLEEKEWRMAQNFGEDNSRMAPPLGQQPLRPHAASSRPKAPLRVQNGDGAGEGWLFKEQVVQDKNGHDPFATARGPLSVPAPPPPPERRAPPPARPLPSFCGGGGYGAPPPPQGVHTG